MTLEAAAKLLGVDLVDEIAAIADNPNSQRGVMLAIAFRDHPQGGAEELAELIIDLGERLGFEVREDINEVIPNLDWWLEEDPAPTGPVLVSARM